MAVYSHGLYSYGLIWLWPYKLKLWPCIVMARRFHTTASRTYIVMAHIVIPHVVMAYIVMALCSYGPV